MEFLSDFNNLLPLTVALLSGFMLFWSFFGNRLRGVQVVDTIGAMQLINHKNAVVLDIRSEKEQQSGVILNARRVPFGSLVKRLTELDKFKKKPVIVVCHNGARSSDACVILKRRGFEQPYALIGGMKAWQKANLPVEKK